MKKYIILALFLIYLSSQAQTIAGGEIYYKLIGTNKYKLTAVVYRQCSGDAINTLYNTEVLGGAYAVAVNYTRTGIKKLHDTCGNPCNKQNQISNAGYEEHTYEAEIDFTKAPYNMFPNNNICNVVFTLSAGVRHNPSNVHNNGWSFIEAGVNICNSFITQNTSPQFLVTPKFEFACNQGAFFNNIGLDTANYDSLAYSLVTPKRSYTDTLTYKSNFSKNFPVTPYCPPNPGVLNCKPLPNAKPPRGFYFNPKNGDMAFTPTNCNEKSTIVLRIDEYRKNPSTGNMEHLGFVIRDFSVKILQTTDNFIPTLTTNNFNPKFCSSYSECRTFNTSDDQYLPSQKQGDTVRVSWINLIKNTTVGLNKPHTTEPEINFCWQPDTFNAKFNEKYLAITYWDRGCNANIQSRLFEVEKIQAKRFSKTYRLSKCGSVVFTILPFQKDSTTKYITSIKKLNSAIPETFSFGLNDSLTVHENGQYIISYSSQINTNNCSYTLYDTVTIANAYNRPILSLNADTLVCKNDSINIQYIQSISPKNQYFRWYFNGNALINTDTFLNKIGVTQNSQIKLIAYNSNGCIAHKEVNFNLKTYNLLNANYTTCIHSNFTLSVLDGNLPKPYTYNWYINGIKTNGSDSILTLSIDNNKNITAEVTDATGCMFTDNTTINPYANYQPNLLPRNVCKDTQTNIEAISSNALQSPNYLWEINNTINYNVYGNIYPIKTDKPTKLKLTINDRYGCIYIDSVNLAIINPIFNIANDTAICVQQILPLKPSKIGRHNTSPIFNWYSNGVLFSNDSIIKHIISKNETIRLKISYNTSCIAEDSVKIYAQQNPAFTMPSAFSICKNSKATISPVYYNPNSIIQYNWYNKNTLVSQKSIANINILNSGYLKLNVTNASKCTTTDSIDITALALPQPSITGKTQYTLKDTIKLALTKTYKNYNWNVGFGNNSLLISADLIGVANGYNIICTVTDSNGCKAADTIVINISDVSHVKSVGLQNIKLNPNPFTSILKLQSLQNGSITITSSDGKITHVQNIVIGENTIILEHLSAGIYYLEFRNENGNWLQKIVKE